MLALGLVNHLFVAYRSLSLVQLAVPFLFGAGWGIGGPMDLSSRYAVAGESRRLQYLPSD
jgi:hypothetical protein